MSNCHMITIIWHIVVNEKLYNQHKHTVVYMVNETLLGAEQQYLIIAQK